MPIEIQPSTTKRRIRKSENRTVTSVSNFGDFSVWTECYDKQESLEQLRLYFATISWEIIVRIFPSHKMIRDFNEYMKSPTYFAKELGGALSIDALSDSFNEMGSAPTMHSLAITSCPNIFNNSKLNSHLVVKTEPEDHS